MSDSQLIEPILTPNSNKYTVFPIEHNDIWALYKEAVKCFWTVEEVDLQQDIEDYSKLSENEQYFIKHVLAFFASADGIVNENLMTNFYNEVQITESKQFYAFQAAIESIHGEMYSLLLDTYIKDTNEKNKLFNSIEEYPIIKKKANWALNWMSSEKPFGERILAFAIIEGIFFSGSFCAIYWLKSRGVMPGLSQANHFISRDEGQHCRHAYLLYNKLENKLTQERVYEILIDAVNIEKEFITEALPVSLLGMNGIEMSKYIEFVSDYLLMQLGCAPYYNTKNPFDWMTYISLENKSNFFESRPTEYQRVEKGEFALDEEF